MKIKLLKEERQKIWEKMRALNEKAEAEDRDLNADEQTTFENLKAEFRAYTARITRQEELDREEAGLRASQIVTPGEMREKPGEEQGTPENRELREAFVRYLRGHSLQPQEWRALQSDEPASGGYVRVPLQVVNELIEDLKSEVFMRKICRVIGPVDAEGLGACRKTAGTSTFAWGGELSEPTADSSLKFGNRNLKPEYMTGLILVSRDLLLTGTVIDVEQLVRGELAAESGELEEQGFLTGPGDALQPLGVFTASDNGISTSRDMSTGNTTTEIRPDNLIRNKMNVKSQYRARGQWLMHTDALLQVMLFKDGEGRYMWQQGLIGNEPDRLLGRPLTIDDFCPNTFQSGLYVGVFGDFRWYWIVDGLTMQMQRLVEKYALSNQDAFLVRRKVSGAPMKEEAFSRIKLG